MILPMKKNTITTILIQHIYIYNTEVATKQHKTEILSR